MFESIFKAISSLFGALFGGGSASKSNNPPKPTPTPKPPVEEEEDELAQDASEVTPDTIVVVTNELDLEIIKEVENENSPQTEAEKEDHVVEEEEEDKDDENDDSNDTTVIIEPEDTNVPTIGGESPDDETPPKDENKPRQRFLWCLDNGHGKLTQGKRSPVFDDGKTQFFEYEFNRDIVKRIIEKLDLLGIAYYNVVPEVNIDNALEERVNRANVKQSNLTKLYVSIHANAAPAPSARSWASPSISGIETWYFHGSSKGQKIAAIFQKHLLAQTGWKNRHLKSQAEGQFYVLRKTRMTAILTENGFYNNKQQAAELMKNSVRQKIADAHVAAIVEIEKNGITGLLG